MRCDLHSKWFVVQLSECIVLDRMETFNFKHIRTVHDGHADEESLDLVHTLHTLHCVH